MVELRIAFAGHIRPEDLGDLGAIDLGLSRAFGLIASALPLGAELVTGLAGGADLHAARAWRAAGLGAIHAVFPFLDMEVPADALALAVKQTWLDGASVEAAGHNPYLTQARWVVEDADLLVVVWTGDPGRGAGGTADSVRLALDRNTPVLWVKPGEPGNIRYISPDALEPDFGFLEVIEQLEDGSAPLVVDATQMMLADHFQQVKDQLTPPPVGVGPSYGRLRQRLDWVLDRSLWRAFALYKSVMAGRARPSTRKSVPVPATLALQPGFKLLQEAYDAADQEAGGLASVHRSQQVFQVSVMIAAAAVGSTPAVWPEIKIYAVLVELSLALATFAVWRFSVRSERTRRWSEARRVAEQLRLEQAAWALGLSTRDDRRYPVEGPASQAAAYWRRRAGQAVGRFDVERTRVWGEWALDALIADQVEYHQRQGRLNAHLSHRGHEIETTVFWMFVAFLALFAGAWFTAHAVDFELPHWLGGLVLMAGAVTPAFGAASLALDSALSFADQGRRSEDMRRRLSALHARLESDMGLEAQRRAARAAVRMQVSQEDRWSDDTAHRHVVRGG